MISSTERGAAAAAAKLLTPPRRYGNFEGVTPKYGIPIHDLPVHCQDAVDAAEHARARTLVTRDGRAVAAIVPMTDLDRIEPPDPGAGGVDPLLALCGACRHDAFVDRLVADFTKTGLWRRGADDGGLAGQARDDSGQYDAGVKPRVQG